MILTTAPVVVSISTTQHAKVLHAGTTFTAVLQTPIDSATAQPGDQIVLLVNDPSYPTLRDAKITAHITRVRNATSQRPALIGFLFDTITFGNGLTEPFRGFVDNARITRWTKQTPQPAAAVGIPNNSYFAPNPNTIVWQKDIGKAPVPTQPTGGHAYSRGAGVPIQVAAGSTAKLELASDLKTP
jgi:hypothetical protein